MKRIAVLSCHPSYDYRIKRHIVSLLHLGYYVTYFNISTENTPTFMVNDNRFEFKHYHISGKRDYGNIFSTFRTISKSLKGYDYFFVQDPILLPLFSFRRSVNGKIVVDIHEKIGGTMSKIEFLFLKSLHHKLSRSCVTAIRGQKYLENKFDHVFVFDNLPMKEDFEFKDMNKSVTRKKTVVYAGMITEEHRFMLKTLDVFELLLQSGEFQTILIGKIANRPGKNRIKKRIEDLQNKFPDDLKFLGSVDHKIVAKIILQSDFGFNLLDFPESEIISPNKNYEYLIGGCVLVTDHSRFSIKIPKEVMLLVGKRASPEEIYQKVSSIAKNESKLRYLQNLSRSYVLENNLYWENYFAYYRKIFS
ncbi:hypothetical protein [Kosmotoga olearia]|uniref:Glycosyl transferase group 1 n=1 Tax=Kosmotoga olearia (strain ATCC BAA-1733 / DSM 21960 / TBF 19.5.1) TaxID=521045 RepID=C5CDB9_KOSOT|nr:hypothetical protein [Kosmotoga olearia]ACR79982.1 hypothetical protein Kole_1288 [Kosmotoga olearia TBF 19.5.1]